MGRDALWVALLSGPIFVALRDGIGWLRHRRKDDAEAGLTVDQRWKNLTDKYENRISALEQRVTAVEGENGSLRERLRGALAEVDRYKSTARMFARHVLKLREALAQSGMEIPELPSDVEDALTIINLP